MGAMLIVLIAIVGWLFYMRQTDSYDSTWPYRDLTSGSYSGGYDGIDISHYQGRIHWEEIRKNKHLKFVYVKATEGKSKVDSCYRRNIDSLHACGIPIGAYHFLKRGATGNQQFANFKRTVSRMDIDLRPVVDCEDDGTRGLSREKIQQMLSAFIKACKEEYGKAPIIYCSESYYKDYLAPEFDNYMLFIANYSKEPVLPGKPKYDIWQYSEKGRLPGIWNWVDLDKLADGVTVDDLKLGGRFDMK